jgi:hypothetical protein
MNEVERIEVWRKKRRALELRLAKVSYRAIAEKLDIQVGTAHAWVKELTAIELPQEDMEEIRTHEADGYDASEQRLLGLMSMVAEQAQRKKDEGLSTDEEVKRIESLERTLMDVRKQRALLLGINRPTLVKHNVTVRNVLDEEIEALVSELAGGGNIMSDPELVDVGDNE